MKKYFYLFVLAFMPMCFIACGGDDSDSKNDGGGFSGNPIDLVEEGDINLSYLHGTWDRYYFAYYVNGKFDHGAVYNKDDIDRYNFGPGEAASYYFKNSKGSDTYNADKYYTEEKNGSIRIYLLKSGKSSYVGDIYALTKDKLVLKYEFVPLSFPSWVLSFFLLSQTQIKKKRILNNLHNFDTK